MSLINNIKREIKSLKKSRSNYNMEILFLTNLVNQLDLLKETLLASNIELLNSCEISFSDFYGNYGISVYLDIFYNSCCYTIRISNHNCWQLGDDCVLNKIINHNDLIFINKKEIYDLKKKNSYSNMSKKQVPKFLICHNEMADDSIYIYHTQTPRFLAKVEGNNIHVVQEIDHLLVNATEIAGIMRRMGDWYVTYQKYKNNH